MLSINWFHFVNWAQEMQNGTLFFETSAQSGYLVEQSIFTLAAKLQVKQKLLLETQVVLKPTTGNKSKKTCCFSWITRSTIILPLEWSWQLIDITILISVWWKMNTFISINCFALHFTCAQNKLKGIVTLSRGLELNWFDIYFYLHKSQYRLPSTVFLGTIKQTSI